MATEEGAAAIVAALNQTVWGEKILEIKPADIKERVERPVRYERVQRREETQKKLRPRRPRIS